MNLELYSDGKILELESLAPLNPIPPGETRHHIGGTLIHQTILDAPVLVRDQISAGWNQVCDAHSFAPGKTTRGGHASSQRDGIFELRRDGEDAQQVPVLQLFFEAAGVQ